MNYKEGVAGILIGAAKGGTIGATIGSVIAQKAHLVIPVGLEKCIGFDITEMHLDMVRNWTEDSKGAALWPVVGTIVTEIEALQQLADVRAVQVGAGGIAGAEGSVRLQVEGAQDQIERIQVLLEETYGEPPFVQR